MAKMSDSTPKPRQGDSTKWWDGIAPKLRRALGLAPLTTEEAETELAEAQEVPITDDEIERIVRFAVGEGASDDRE